MQTTLTQQNKGFALLFAVLTASLLLSIGVSIFNLTVKELLLSSSGRESQYAFYAADTGAECALYWDLKGRFATSTDSLLSDMQPSGGQANPDCVDSIGAIQYFDATSTNAFNNNISSGGAITQFNLVIPNSPTNYCATVTVSKTIGLAGPMTVIDSRGYNTCTVSDPNRTERGLRITY